MRIPKIAYFSILIVLALALASYFYLSHFKVTKEQEPPQVTQYPQLDPQELSKDPTAPAWMKDAESCQLIDGKVFCKMKGE